MALRVKPPWVDGYTRQFHPTRGGFAPSINVVGMRQITAVIDNNLPPNKILGCSRRLPSAGLLTAAYPRMYWMRRWTRTLPVADTPAVRSLLFLTGGMSGRLAKTKNFNLSEATLIVGFPPEGACLNTRYPRRPFASGQVDSRNQHADYDQPSARRGSAA